MLKSRPYQSFLNYLEQPVSIAPLVTFRIAFGLVMLFSTLRYMAMGWVNSQLIDPIMHFHYFGFEWVKPLPDQWMYAVFALLILSNLGILLGLFYRISALLFFLCFSYIELIDITYYLNHYYFVSIVSFLLILVPAHQYFSLDVVRKPALLNEKVSRWCILIFKLQIAIVYIYAGLAKINCDWLFKALPLAIWLPAKTSLPLFGFIFNYKITAFLFSWIGMFFDTFVILFLMWRKTRWLAYIAVVIFHTLTGLLFQIGVFPLVMILVVTIFFSDHFHQQLIQGFSRITTKFSLYSVANGRPRSWQSSSSKSKQKLKPLISSKLLLPFLAVFFLFQLLFPWRYLLYSGNVFWTEEGYRFSWRVMLMEKAGTATFYVKDGESGREGSVINRQFLNPHQEKQMAMQADMILQFAHYLANHYKQQGMKTPKVRVEAWVTLNARPSQLLIDPTIDLTKLQDTWQPKDWILPFDKPQER